MEAPIFWFIVVVLVGIFVPNIWVVAFVGCVALWFLVPYFWNLVFPSATEEQIAESAKQEAGWRAEQYVNSLLTKFIADECPSRTCLHDTLVVFNADLPNEYSAEVDHLFIGMHNIYLIETKYKSGVVSADANSPIWKVTKGEHSRPMRNALLQAKNTARVFSKEFNLPCKIVPIVAIRGTDVSVIEGPSNVVVATDVVKTIKAFEHSSTGSPTIHPQEITRLILSKSKKKTTGKYFDRHIDRIQAKTAKREAEQAHKRELDDFKDIVDNASVD